VNLYPHIQNRCAALEGKWGGKLIAILLF